MTIAERGSQNSEEFSFQDETPIPPEQVALGGIHISLYFPPNVLTNREIATWNASTKSGKPLTAGRIAQLTGIERRAIADPMDTVQTLGEQAALPIVDEFGNDITTVSFLTSYPSLAARMGSGHNHAGTLAENFGLPNILTDITTEGYPEAHDRYKACSSFADFMISQQARIPGHVLVVASEIYSPTLPDLSRGEADPSLSQTIFGDGAAAMSYRQGDIEFLRGEVHGFTIDSRQAIQMPIDYSAMQEPYDALDIPTPEQHGQPTGKFYMDGGLVYKQMVPKLQTMITDFVNKLDVDQDELKVVPHQASQKMLEGVRDQLPEWLREKFYINVADGNYSSASIIKALAELIRNREIRLGDTVVFAGFGAGLYAALSAVRFNKI